PHSLPTLALISPHSATLSTIVKPSGASPELVNHASLAKGNIASVLFGPASPPPGSPGPSPLAAAANTKASATKLSVKKRRNRVGQVVRRRDKTRTRSLALRASSAQSDRFFRQFTYIVLARCFFFVANG